MNLEDCTNGRDAHVKSGGLSDSVQVRKVFCSLPDSFQSEPSFKRKEDYLCRDKIRDSVAISVQVILCRAHFQPGLLCKFRHTQL